MLQRILVFVAILFSQVAFSQTAHRQYRSVFPQNGNYEPNGWLFAGGFTYTQPWPYTQREVIQQSPGVSSQRTYTARGRVGINAELGRFNEVSANGLVNFIDYSLGFKYFRGVEKFDALSVPEFGNGKRVLGKGVFNQGYITFNFNLNKVSQIGDFWFLKNTLGLNGDYRILSSYAYESKKLPVSTDLPVEMQAQVHYKLGIGFKASKNLILIPSIETPIVTVYQFDHFRSSYSAFNSTYRPLIMRLEVLLLDHKAGRKCPTGPKKSQQSGLFGKPGKR